jgi:hypothetical protein
MKTQSKKSEEIVTRGADGLSTLTEHPYPEKKVKPVYNPNVEYQDNSSIDVMRITQEAELTRIDFVHRASPIRINGGWVRIEPETFIRPVNTNMRLTMVQAVNIPLAPAMHWYKNNRECLYYTLFFPRLPDDVVAIDIIEREVARPHNFFNLYAVSLERIATEIIIVNN